MLCGAFSNIFNSSQWVTACGADDPPRSERSEISELCPQSYLHPGPGSAVFPFSDEITTSFYPMLEKQFMKCVQKPPIESKINNVYRYFEDSMGRFFDSDGDSVADSYQYNTALPQCESRSSCPTGDYSVWATANLLVAITLPDDAYLFMSVLFHPSVLPFEMHFDSPKV